jgi:hypothetical protein
MTKHTLNIAILIVASHFCILIEIIWLWLKSPKGFLFPEMVTAIGLIGPLFAGYTTVILNTVIKTGESTIPAGTENIAYKSFSLAIPLTFSLVVAGAVYCWGFKIGFTDFEEFKILVGLIQGAFGVYVGLFIYSIFKKEGA